MNVSKSKAGTFFIKGRGIPKGCQLCLNGTKTVLFINGLCQNPKHCYWYCPISNERKGKDFTYANEIKIKSKEELIDEINLMNAKGMSLTGGDPLFGNNFEKTLEFIKYVKMRKGKKFHIHLYTNGLNFSEEIAIKLAEAGLDEIRFNPPKENWNVIQSALNKGFIVGAEVPVIPNKKYLKELEDFIIYLDKIGAEFINLNEFEFSFPNSQHLKERGFILKKGSIASVEKSKEKALELLRKIHNKVNLQIHFCPIRTKDYWQLKERYIRRAKSIKMPYEDLSEEGLLLFAQIEGNVNALKEFKDFLINEIKIPQKYVNFNKMHIKMPLTFALEDKFIELLEERELNGFIVEITPFREEEYCQTTEKTPIKVFKEEMSIDGD
ncbi:MAG: radical SAM protein [Candidatus Hermodarchaeota archaeon]